MVRATDAPFCRIFVSVGEICQEILTMGIFEAEQVGHKIGSHSLK